uniref:WD_REPEATS_REGION domain-containing protein n=1 Tax=Trichuris muris TaxID=70415 RepID=A0A5S6Q940_TRIMR
MLRRYTSLNHLAQAARTVLQNSAQMNQMLTDLSRVDFRNVQEQAGWVCGCDFAMVQQIEQDFKETLEKPKTLEQLATWLDFIVGRVLPSCSSEVFRLHREARKFLLHWSFYSSMLMRDLTLRSAPSFGSFHLIRLLFDEYMYFLVEQRISSAVDLPAVAIMSQVINNYFLAKFGHLSQWTLTAPDRTVAATSVYCMVVKLLRFARCLDVEQFAVASSASMSDTEVDNKEELIQWQHHSTLLNDFHSLYSQPWPFGLCKWINKEADSGIRGWNMYSILLGTGVEEPYGQIMIGKFGIPRKNEQGKDSVDEMAQPIAVDRMMELGDFVVEALNMPQNADKIAIITSEDVLFFDWTKCTKESETGVFEMRLRGSEKMGHSLSWNPYVEGYLLCASEHCSIALWDINRPDENGVLMANVNFLHDRKINEVAWHPLHETLFGSVGDDSNLLIWDTRFNSRNRPILAALAHGERALCLSFNSFSEYIVATGSADKSIAIWDIRNLNVRLRMLSSFDRSEVRQVEWSPHEEFVLASRGDSSTVSIWDLDRIQRNRTTERDSEGPPELFFVQGGHNGKVYDFSWNPSVPWFLSSVDADSLHIWHVPDDWIA